MGLEDINYQSLTRPIASDGLLVLFTDGLVERRGESLDVGLERLARAMASGPDDPQRLCEHILAHVLPEEGSLDDVTAVVVRIARRARRRCSGSALPFSHRRLT